MGGKGNYCAIREVGLIRLMAAASYLQMMYKWGTKPGYSKGEDMIANLDNVGGSTPGYILRMPINPRSKIVNNKMITPSVAQLKGQLIARSARMTQLQAHAKAQAEADKKPSVQVSQSVIDQFKAAATMSPTQRAITSSIPDAFKSGTITFAKAVDNQLKCKNSGGEWFPGGAACDVPKGGGSIYNCRAPGPTDVMKYYCVPAGTPGASSISETGEVSKGPSVGTILTIAGAGLLLMRLLKA